VGWKLVVRACPHHFVPLSENQCGMETRTFSTLATGSSELSENQCGMETRRLLLSSRPLLWLSENQCGMIGAVVSGVWWVVSGKEQQCENRR